MGLSRHSKEGEWWANILAKDRDVASYAEFNAACQIESCECCDDHEVHEEFFCHRDPVVEQVGLEPAGPGEPVNDVVRWFELWLSAVQIDIRKDIIVAVVDSRRHDAAPDEEPEVLIDHAKEGHAIRRFIEHVVLFVDLIQTLRLIRPPLARLQSRSVMGTSRSLAILVDESGYDVGIVSEFLLPILRLPN